MSDSSQVNSDMAGQSDFAVEDMPMQVTASDTTFYAEFMIEFRLWFLDGSQASQRINRYATLRQLKNKIKEYISQPCFTLVPFKGCLLEPEDILGETDWRDGGDLQVVTHRPLVAAAQKIVYAWSRDDDRFAVWGQSGSPCILRSPFFWGVTACNTNMDACAMITRSGQIACVGCEGPTPRQQGVACYIQATDLAFAAILATGNVIAWGDPLMGGDCSEIEHELNNVIAIQRTSQAFAALRADGHVISWGNPTAGGCSARVRARLCNIHSLQGSDSAFAAITHDFDVVCWGDPDDGGDETSVAAQLKGVVAIQATRHAFAAIRQDATVITWGCTFSGGDSSRVSSSLQQVTAIQSSHSAFAALRSDGRLVCWGDPHAGGSIPNSWMHRQVKAVQGNVSGFAALQYDNSIITWGNFETFNVTEVQLSQPFRCIAASSHAFAGLTEQGRIVAWGEPKYGGDASSVQESLSDVRELTATSAAFIAITEPGMIITWGDKACGGDCRDLNTFFLTYF